MQQREKIRQLFERYREGRCTPEEEARLHAWFDRYASSEASGLNELRNRYYAERVYKRRRWLRLLPYTAAAAAIVFVVGWYINENPVVNHESQIVNLTSTDIAPGGNRATLTLADGHTIDLSESQSGIVVGPEITYFDGSSVIEVSMETGKETDGELNVDEFNSQTHPLARLLTLNTPKGGTYQITLSDGTKVWLNAESTLRYPSRFASDERVVEIEGEGYFVVAKDSKKPFKVISRGQRIDVLGTQFNISAYSEDTEVRTTLIEGALKLQSKVSGAREMLLPGEEGLLTNGHISKKKVDPSSAIAWKEGNFYFDDTPVEDMLKQIARWYSVDVVYEREVPKERFSGGMSRNVTLQTVLALLRISEIKYRIEADRLIIE